MRPVILYTCIFQNRCSVRKGYILLACAENTKWQQSWNAEMEKIEQNKNLAKRAEDRDRMKGTKKSAAHKQTAQKLFLKYKNE